MSAIWSCPRRTGPVGQSTTYQDLRDAGASQELLRAAAIANRPRQRQYRPSKSSGRARDAARIDTERSTEAGLAMALVDVTVESEQRLVTCHKTLP
jgi:hypothetical protein